MGIHYKTIRIDHRGLDPDREKTKHEIVVEDNDPNWSYCTCGRFAFYSKFGKVGVMEPFKDHCEQ